MPAPERQVALSQRAKRELDQVFSYLEKEASYAVADDVASRIAKRISALGSRPFLGVQVEGFPNVRSVHERPYVIFYRITDRIVVLRVRHERRGPTKAL